MIIFPSYYFLPTHASGVTYHGHGKVYAHQEWGSTHNTYETMNNVSLPSNLLPPDSENSVSILISSYNTNIVYINECLDSIKNQTGYFNMEIVWVNDGSDLSHTIELKSALDNFIKTTRFTTLVYHENETNMTLPVSLNIGLLLCNNEIIIRMDSDDIMVPNRIDIQFNFMENHPLIHICGGQVQMFRDNINNIVDKTDHPSITWDDYKLKKLHWIANHPTLCYRKHSVISVGNYNKELNILSEDLDLELRMLKKYKILFNFKEILLYYRLHQNNLTNNLKINPEHWNNLRLHIINDIISDK
jgi:glycosyltransferase involved in cell wall biosynthesis